MKGKVGLSAGVLLAALVAAAGWLHHHTTRFDQILSQAAAQHSLDFYLVKALVFEESWFRPDIRGSSGELGLMQISVAAAADYAAEKGFLPFYEARLLEPRLNVEIGCWYLRRSMERYRDTPNPTLFALLRYNAGEGRSGKWVLQALAHPVPEGISADEHYLSFVDFPTTREYVRRILRRTQARHYWF